MVFRNPILLSLFLAFGVTSPCRADRIADLVPTESRSLAMGNTGISLLTDSYAMFFNPANLANKQVKPRIELINVQGDVSADSSNAVASKRINPMNLNGSYPYLKENSGRWISNRASLYPNFTSRFFSLGFLYQEEFSAKYQESDPKVPTQPSLRQTGYRDIGPTAALSFRMFGGILKMGYAAHLQTIGVVDKTVFSPDAATKEYRNGMSTTLGLTQTAGLTVTLPVSNLPTFGVVARNIGGSNNPRGRTPMHYDVGVGYTKYLGRNLHIRAEVDLRDVTNQLEAGRMRRLFTGGELKFFNVLALRAGYAQGYPSGGLGLQMKRTRVDFAWYSEEMGNGLREDRNQHWLMQITWSIFN